MVAPARVGGRAILEPAGDEMPIYEYLCAGCGHAFEALVYGSERPRCPECESEELEKQFSTFAARGETRPDLSGPGACGTCGDPRGPGSCSTN